MDIDETWHEVNGLVLPKIMGPSDHKPFDYYSPEYQAYHEDMKHWMKRRSAQGCNCNFCMDAKVFGHMVSDVGL